MKPFTYRFTRSALKLWVCRVVLSTRLVQSQSLDVYNVCESCCVIIVSEESEDELPTATAPHSHQSRQLHKAWLV